MLIEMKDETKLTEEERLVLREMTIQRKWNIAEQNLTILLPSLVMSVYGILKADVGLAIFGWILYLILRIRLAIRQEAMMKPIQSGLRKVLEEGERAVQASSEEAS